MSTCWIIAGPNGAGKTTFSLEYLPSIADNIRFINADLIAAGLSPLAPERKLLNASKLFLSEVEGSINSKIDFAVETTLSGRSYFKLVRRLKAARWRVEMVYLALPNIEMSKRRVAERVAHGGHNIANKDVERRFPRSLNNLLMHMAGMVDRCFCYMNESSGPVLIFEQQGENRNIICEEHYKTLLKGANI